MEQRKSSFRSAEGLAFTPSALEAFRAFAKQLGRSVSRDPWVPGFVWFTSSKMREHKNAPIVDLGPGLDIGGFHLSEVKQDDLTTIDGHRALVQIPDEVLASFSRPTIDYVTRTVPDTGKMMKAFVIVEGR